MAEAFVRSSLEGDNKTFDQLEVRHSAASFLLWNLAAC